MQAQSALRKPWLALILLGGEYVLLGWFLAAHHIFWLVGTFIVVLTLAVIWKKNPILEFLAWMAQQQIVVLLGGSFLLSLLIALAFVQPILVSLSLLPIITLAYALLEMRTSAFKQGEVFLWSVVITGLGLGLGEAIDLFITPSMRY
jgi:hypothetical protein